MAIPPEIRLTPTEAALVQQLAALAGLDDAQARQTLIEAGLAALRLEAAIHLHTTTSLSTGEIADQTGVNRGELLHVLQARGLTRYDDSALDASALEADLNARLARRVAQWQGRR
jgi:predicted HTH domain antitoxin